MGVEVPGELKSPQTRDHDSHWAIEAVNSAGPRLPPTRGLRLPPRGTTVRNNGDYDSHPVPLAQTYGGLRLPDAGLRLPSQPGLRLPRAGRTRNSFMMLRSPVATGGDARSDLKNLRSIRSPTVALTDFPSCRVFHLARRPTSAMTERSRRLAGSRSTNAQSGARAARAQ